MKQHYCVTKPCEMHANHDTTLRAVHKGRPQSRGGGLSSVDIFGQEEFFKCGRPHFLVRKKNRIFRNLWCIRAPHGQGGKGGLSHCGQGVGGQFFAILYERPL